VWAFRSEAAASEHDEDGWEYLGRIHEGHDSSQSTDEGACEGRDQWALLTVVGLEEGGIRFGEGDLQE
jgi:hypothetical protein